MNTQIYCDIADYKIIKKYSKYKIVKGFTTNPSLMRKAGAKNYEMYSKKILKLTKKPVSLENIKKNNSLKHLSLIKQSRLSVMPIDLKSWKIICKMGKI